MTTYYLTMADILAIHKDQIEMFGGADGIRDIGLLEAALFRPQTGYYQDVLEEAAAMWESLAQNHPFIDGNKRTAFDATATFLEMNGYEIKSESDDIYTFIMNLYDTKSFDKDHLDAWLRANTGAV